MTEGESLRHNQDPTPIPSQFYADVVVLHTEKVLLPLQDLNEPESILTEQEQRSESKEIVPVRTYTEWIDANRLRVTFPEGVRRSEVLAEARTEAKGRKVLSFTQIALDQFEYSLEPKQEKLIPVARPAREPTHAEYDLGVVGGIRRDLLLNLTISQLGKLIEAKGSVASVFSRFLGKSLYDSDHRYNKKDVTVELFLARPRQFLRRRDIGDKSKMLLITILRELGLWGKE